jgi:hypothetical protein
MSLPHGPTDEILKSLHALEAEMEKGMRELEGMLK